MKKFNNYQNLSLWLNNNQNKYFLIPINEIIPDGNFLILTILGEEKIWHTATDLKRSNTEWSEIVNYLIPSLEDYLQQPIKILDETIEQSIVEATVRLIRKYGNPNNKNVKWLQERI